jgi:LPS O-antigen subunit length determinant protein (WzzB/FepE family)
MGMPSRLVGIFFGMNQTEAVSTPLTNDDAIDIKVILAQLIEGRLWIFLGVFLGGAVAIYQAFVVKKPVFESLALLIATESERKGGQFSEAAALFGESSDLFGGDAELYQSLLSSRTVMYRTLLTTFHDARDTATIHEKPLFQILNLDTANKSSMESELKTLSESIEVGTKEKRQTSILNVKGRAEYPWLAQQLTNVVLKNGQEELRRVRVERYDAIMERLSVAVNMARREWDSTAKNLAYYKDRNRSISLADQALELSRLELEKQAKEQKYFLARKELEQQQMNREKATPPMLILDSANFPAKQSGPKRVLIIVAGLMAGFVCGCASVLGKAALKLR